MTDAVRSPAADGLCKVWETWAVWIFACGWLCVASYLAVQQHAAFHTHLFDTGYYTQVLWNTSRGAWFANSLKYPSFLADHFSPALLLLAPLFWLAPNSYPLQIAKIVALGAPAIPLYAAVRQHHARLAPLVALVYLLNPFLHRTALEEFHEIMLAAPAVALAWYAAHREDVPLLLGALAFLLLVREDMGVYVVLFGLYVGCCYPHRRWLGLAVGCAGLVWLVATAAIVLPLLRSGTGQTLGGAQASAQLAAALRDPLALLGSLLSREKSLAVLALLAPLAGLPLLARGEQILWGGGALFLLTLPFSSVGGLTDWYVAPLIPLLCAGAAAALCQAPLRAAWPGAALLLAAGTICFYLWSPFPGGRAFIPAEYVVTDHHRTGHAVLAAIPPDADVVTQSGLGAHLAARRRVALYPWNQPHKGREFWVFDTQNQDIYPLAPDEFWAIINRLRQDPSASLVQERDGYLVFLVQQ